MLVDSHCHLDSKNFKNRLPEAIDNMKKNDVGAVLLSCSRLEKFENIVKITDQIAERYQNVFVSVGIHPNADKPSDYKQMEETFDGYLNQYKNKIVCIGECGLDYHYRSDNETKKSQKELFRIQLEIAQKANLPVMVHARDAGVDTYETLSGFVKNGGKGVIHCFTGTCDDAKRYLELGFYISACGAITYDGNDELRKIFSDIPLESLLVETDSPCLAPKPFKSSKNEPAYVKFVAEKLAEIKNTSFEEIAFATTENFKNIYNVKIVPDI